MPCSGADHVQNALALILHVEELQGELGAVAFQRLDLPARHRICDACFTRLGRHVVVGGGEHRAGAPGLQLIQAQAVESLRAGHLVDEVKVDVQQRLAVVGIEHGMACPEFFEKRLCSHLLSLPFGTAPSRVRSAGQVSAKQAKENENQNPSNAEQRYQQ